MRCVRGATIGHGVGKYSVKTSKNGSDPKRPVEAGASRHPIDFPIEEDILAFAPEGWRHYIRQLGTDFIAQVSVYNEVADLVDALNGRSTASKPTPSPIGNSRINWLPEPHVLLLENSELGVCWMFWVSNHWTPMETDPDTPGSPVRRRVLQLADVLACIKLMSPGAYSEHLQWEMERSKH
jgi:hypothetical protein